LKSFGKNWVFGVQEKLPENTLCTRGKERIILLETVITKNLKPRKTKQNSADKVYSPVLPVYPSH
jgi:hypothetical protein